MIWEGQLFQQPFAYDDLDAELVPETIRQSEREI